MGGILENIWCNDETIDLAMSALRGTLADFRRIVLEGLRAYKRWSEGLMLEKKPEEIWPNYYLKDFHFDREKLVPIAEKLGNQWKVNYYHRELCPGVKEMLHALKARGYRKPNPEIFRIALRQMRVKAGGCVYMGDTISRDIIGAKRTGFGKAVQIYSRLSAQKDAEVVNAAEKPDVVIANFKHFIQWLDQENPDIAPKS